MNIEKLLSFARKSIQFPANQRDIEAADAFDMNNAMAEWMEEHKDNSEFLLDCTLHKEEIVFVDSRGVEMVFDATDAVVQILNLAKENGMDIEHYDTYFFG